MNECANTIAWPNVAVALGFFVLVALIVWKLPAIIRAVEGDRDE